MLCKPRYLGREGQGGESILHEALTSRDINRNFNFVRKLHVLLFLLLTIFYAVRPEESSHTLCIHVLIMFLVQQRKIIQIFLCLFVTLLGSHGGFSLHNHALAVRFLVVLVQEVVILVFSVVLTTPLQGLIPVRLGNPSLGRGHT